MIDALSHYREVWLADFEFRQSDGNRPEPLCMVAREFRTGRTLRLWEHELADSFLPPFDVGDDCLFVAYYASAELGCFEALGWSMPTRILDLFAEFRRATNGLGTTCGNGLLGALSHYGLDGIDAAEKSDMRDLILQGGPYSEAEQQAILDYCESDVVALSKLLPVMLPRIDLPRALLRGRYMAAAARMEWNGVPIDNDLLLQFRNNWEAIKGKLTREIDKDYGVFLPTSHVNPTTRLGEAIYSTAAAIGVAPSHLAKAVDEVHERHEQTFAPIIQAEKSARDYTGLTVNRISKWEDNGGDYSSWPDLDWKARELASWHPELGMGRGYVDGEGYDDTDHAQLLWDRLKNPTATLKPKHHPDIIAEAVELVNGAPADDDSQLSFSVARFSAWLIANGIPWPRLESGALQLNDDTFRQMARTYPAVSALRELRHTLGEMRLFSDLQVGADSRNRCLLSAFRSLTGRNQPSNAKFIFGPSTWLRGLIRPEPGRAIAYIDWSQQEFGIAARLSGDPAMQEAYSSGDPYLTFAKQAGAVPPDGTKQTHKAERELFKVCALAVQYGMAEQSLARSLDKPEAIARELLRLHRTTYPLFWKWSQAAVDHAMLRGWLHTVFGWKVTVGPQANPRSLANFPCQANGAEMLRLACCLATERGIQVCAPVHDALLVEGADDEIETVVAGVQEAMAEASREVLSGFELRSDSKIVRHPDRYSDPRGERMWSAVLNILGSLQEADSTCVETVESDF